MRKHFILIIVLLLICCKQNTTEPETFGTYSQVEEHLTDSSFEIDEVADTSNSSFITSAHYQSKDRKTGFLTLGMKGKPYYFQNVPISVWIDFKNAESKGKFYHSKIKNQGYDITLK